MPPPPSSTLFPYTTLFRSRSTCRELAGTPLARTWAARSQIRAAPAYQVSSSAAATRCCRRPPRSEEHTSELQSRGHLVCRLLLEKKNRRASTTMLMDDDHS